MAKKSWNKSEDDEQDEEVVHLCLMALEDSTANDINT